MIALSCDGLKIFSPWADSDRALYGDDDHRGGGRVMDNLSDSDRAYIAIQIDRYEAFSKAFEAFQQTRRWKTLLGYRESCLWRIASCTGLLGDSLDPGGTLTDQQWNQVIDFVEQFKSGQH